MQWRLRAYACVNGGQDIYRLLGRDPFDDPMSALEMLVFTTLVSEIASEQMGGLLNGVALSMFGGSGEGGGGG